MFLCIGMAVCHTLLGLFMLACATLGVESINGLPWGMPLDQVAHIGTIQLLGGLAYAALAPIVRRFV
jgi:hypothetical protein